MEKSRAVALLIAVNAVTVFGQTQTSAGAASHVAIEVASIKPSDPAACKEYPIIDGHNDTIDMKCVKAKLLITMAYGVRDFQVMGGPGWLATDPYDIITKVVSSPDESRVPEKDVAELTDEERRTKGARLREVLIALLADRFQLKTHRETKELQVFVLKEGKSGAKLKGTEDSDVSGGLRVGNGFLAGKRTDIPFLAQTLSQIVGRPIENQTGLTGKYDFELKWTPDQSSPNGALGETLPPAAAVDPDRPNIFTALQEQLGLRLESGKGRVDVVVVDHVERASAN